MACLCVASRSSAASNDDVLVDYDIFGSVGNQLPPLLPLTKSEKDEIDALIFTDDNGSIPPLLIDIFDTSTPSELTTLDPLQEVNIGDLVNIKLPPSFVKPKTSPGPSKTTTTTTTPSITATAAATNEVGCVDCEIVDLVDVKTPVSGGDSKTTAAANTTPTTVEVELDGATADVDITKIVDVKVPAVVATTTVVVDNNNSGKTFVDSTSSTVPIETTTSKLQETTTNLLETTIVDLVDVKTPVSGGDSKTTAANTTPTTVEAELDGATADVDITKIVDVKVPAVVATTPVVVDNNNSGKTFVDSTSSTVPIETTTSKLPESTTNLLETTSQLPDTTTALPETTKKLPEATTMLTETTAKLPATATKLPETTTKLPETTTKLSETTTKLPETTTELPTIPTELPSIVTNMPETTKVIPPQTGTARPPTRTTTNQVFEIQTTTLATTRASSTILVPTLTSKRTFFASPSAPPPAKGFPTSSPPRVGSDVPPTVAPADAVAAPGLDAVCSAIRDPRIYLLPHPLSCTKFLSCQHLGNARYN